VSTLQLGGGTQYRVLGDPAPQYQATPVEPSLEDGYMWMMRLAVGGRGEADRAARRERGKREGMAV
jgi:hypothetical protein